MSAAADDPGGLKAIWGAKLWRFFHLMAEISNRRDVAMIWKSMLAASAHALPCEKCRSHFCEYLRSHSFITLTSPTASGDAVRTEIRQSLIKFHNDVNAHLGKKFFTKEEFNKIYPYRTHAVNLSEIQKLYEELKNLWNPLVHSKIKPEHFMEWKKQTNLLLALLAGGPN